MGILDVAARATFNEISASIAILCSHVLDFEPRLDCLAFCTIDALPCIEENQVLDVAQRLILNGTSASIALDFSGLTQIGLPGHLNPELCDTRSSSHSYALSKQC